MTTSGCRPDGSLRTNASVGRPARGAASRRGTGPDGELTRPRRVAPSASGTAAQVADVAVALDGSAGLTTARRPSLGQVVLLDDDLPSDVRGGDRAALPSGQGSGAPESR